MKTWVGGGRSYSTGLKFKWVMTKSAKIQITFSGSLVIIKIKAMSNILELRVSIFDTYQPPGSRGVGGGGWVLLKCRF